MVIVAAVSWLGVRALAAGPASQPAQISGVIHLPDGKPAAGAVVAMALPGQAMVIHNAKNVDGGPRHQVTTGTDGQYKFAAPEGAFTLVVLHERGYAEARLSAPAGSIADALAQAFTDPTPHLGPTGGDITLQAWGRVEGTVMKGKRPVPKQKISLSRQSTEEGRQSFYIVHDQQVEADAQGHFVFERVPPGEVQLGRVIQRGVAGPTTNPAVEWAMSQVITAGPRVTALSGQTVKTQIGGNGRTVMGKLVAPPGAALSWWQAQGYLQPGAPAVVVPEELKPALAKLRERAADPRDTFAQKMQWVRQAESSPEAEALHAAENKARSDMYRNMQVHQLMIGSDGTFSAEDVPAGNYMMQAMVVAQHDGKGELAARAEKNVTVPPAPAGQEEAPVNLGDVVMDLSTEGESAEMPAFEVKTPAGQTIKLTDYRGKYVLLHFWASWCRSCQPSIANLKAVHDTMAGDERLVTVGLNFDESPDAAKAWIAKQQMTWTQGLLGDWSKTTAPGSFGVQSLPGVVLIGPDGKIIARNLSGRQVMQAVNTALGPK